MVHEDQPAAGVAATTPLPGPGPEAAAGVAAPATPPAAPGPGVEAPAPRVVEDEPVEAAPEAIAAVDEEAAAEAETAISPPAAAPAPPPPAAKPPPPPSPFAVSDQDARARRLARALISDLAAYHPERQEKGLREGRLKELFQDDLRKSWQQYVEQVGLEVAKNTPFFRDALNEILARGKTVF